MLHVPLKSSLFRQAPAGEVPASTRASTEAQARVGQGGDLARGWGDQGTRTRSSVRAPTIQGAQKEEP